MVDRYTSPVAPCPGRAACAGIGWGGTEGVNLDRLALNALSRLGPARPAGGERPRAAEARPPERLPPGRHRVLFQAAPVAILICDPRGRILDANEEAVRLSGWPRDALRRTTLHALVAGGDRGATVTGVLSWWGRLLDGAGALHAVRVLEGRPLGGEDGPRPCFLLPPEVASSAPPGSEGNATGDAVALARGVAQALGGTLSTVMGYVEALRAHLPAEGAATLFLQDLACALEDGVRLAEDLDQLGRCGGGAPCARPLGDLLHGLVGALTEALGATIRLEVELPAEAPVVQVDADLLGQGLLAFARATRQGLPNGGRWQVKATYAQGDDAVVIVLRDTGETVDPTDVAHVFEPYARLRADRVDRGLALALGRRFLERAGATVGVLPGGGRGLGLEVRLPVAVG